MAIQPLGEEETENQAAYLPPAGPVQRLKGGGLDIFDGDELNNPWSQCHQPLGPFGDCLWYGSSQGNKAISTKFQGKMIFNLETYICSYDFKCESRIKTFKAIQGLGNLILHILFLRKLLECVLQKNRN